MGCSVYDSSLLGGDGGGGGNGGVVSGGGAAADSGGPSALAGAVATGGAGGGRSGAPGLENSAGVGGDAGAAGMLGEGGAASPGNGGGAGAGTAGTSGRSGAGGTSGSSGSAGSVGLGGSSGRSGAGGGGTSGAGGSAAGAGGGGVVTANGCAVLSVPLTAAGNQARFDISLASSANFSAATISMRVYVKAGVGGVISSYVQDTAFNVLHNSTTTPLKTVSGWQTLTWNIGAQGPGSSGIALTGVSRIGIEINASPDTTWSNPTLVYVDSIAVSSPALSFSFDTSGTVTSTSGIILDVAGQVLWLNAYSEDTTATGVTLGWLASCP